MLLYKLERIEEYAQYLQNNPTEVTALYHDVLIHVTSFFRDPESFEALSSKVFPEIVKDKSPQTPIRIWIAGCSTGEEAYSIAICLLEFLAERATHLPIQIYATDICETAIANAAPDFIQLAKSRMFHPNVCIGSLFKSRADTKWVSRCANSVSLLDKT